MHRRFLIAITAGAVVALCASTATSYARTVSHNPMGRILGVVHARGAKTTASTSSNLIYNGGSVLNTNTVYAIFWSPSNYPIASSYQSLIQRFYTDVAADTDASLSSNVYYADTQYGPGTFGSPATTSGSLQNYSTFGGAYIDTTPIKNGCKDRYTSICVTDSQVQTEITNDLSPSKSGWSAGSGKIFFMFTPKGVGSCYGSGDCSFSQWCAYHSWSGNLIYANMPFADTVSRACDAGYHPNSGIDPNADATINVASHEHNESITDPFGTAWYNNAGYENGDLCAWKFGAVTNQANQTIGNHPYIAQLEWSNLSGACVQHGT
jgi:hypothetical protein